MQTSVPQLMQWGERTLALNHEMERQALEHRADELAAISAALAGAPITITGITLMHVGRDSAPLLGRLSNDVLVHAEALAADELDVRAALAGLRTFASATASTLFEHPTERWMLTVAWLATPIIVEEAVA